MIAAAPNSSGRPEAVMRRTTTPQSTTRRMAPRTVICAIVVTGLAAIAATLVNAAPAAATDAYPCAQPQVFRASHWVQYCPLTQANVPVFGNPDQGNNAPIVGRLVYGGSANWFVGESYRSRYTRLGYFNSWWAFTLADNGRWGWVPEVFFRGGNNNEADSGLYTCGFAYNRCSP